MRTGLPSTTGCGGSRAVVDSYHDRVLVAEVYLLNLRRVV
jgi:hypothetical protein